MEDLEKGIFLVAQKKMNLRFSLNIQSRRKPVLACHGDCKARPSSPFGSSPEHQH